VETLVEAGVQWTDCLERDGMVEVLAHLLAFESALLARGSHCRWSFPEKRATARKRARPESFQ
jgi:hypothetical protein